MSARLQGHSFHIPSLKVPKREIFVTELYTLSEAIWVGDLGTEAKNPFVKCVRQMFAIFFFTEG
jgi:hypothetical protein